VRPTHTHTTHKTDCDCPFLHSVGVLHQAAPVRAAEPTYSGRSVAVRVKSVGRCNVGVGIGCGVSVRVHCELFSLRTLFLTMTSLMPGMICEDAVRARLRKKCSWCSSLASSLSRMYMERSSLSQLRTTHTDTSEQTKQKTASAGLPQRGANKPRLFDYVCPIALRSPFVPSLRCAH
jgi:hypothetical protein